MPEQITITVRGTPAPQGSKRGFAIRKGGAYTGKVAMADSGGDRLRTWRRDVIGEAVRAMHGIIEPPSLGGRGEDWLPFTGPVAVVMVFALKRPAGHYRTGRNAHLLRDSAPSRPSKMPDLDKLVRATADSLTDAGIWADDGQVVTIRAAKTWAGQTVAFGVDGELYGLDVPGAVITTGAAT